MRNDKPSYELLATLHGRILMEHRTPAECHFLSLGTLNKLEMRGREVHDQTKHWRRMIIEPTSEDLGN